MEFPGHSERARRCLIGAAVALVLAEGAPASGWSAPMDVVLHPTDDTFISLVQPELNFDEHADQVRVATVGFPVAVPEDIGYLRFDLSGLAGPVDGARLRLYNLAAPGATLTVAAFAVASDDWNGAAAGLGDETTLVAANAPAEGAPLGSQPGGAQAGWVEFTGTGLRDYVNQEIAGDRVVTFRLRVTSRGMADVCIFREREGGADVAELVLEPAIAGSRLSGMVVLQGRASAAGVTVTALDAAGAPVVSTLTDAGGAWALTGLPAGAYALSAEMPRYLDGRLPAAGVGIVVPAGGEVVSPPVRLVAGDANDDDRVDLADAVLLGAAFGQPVGGDGPADVNGDGVVDILDLALVGANYGKRSVIDVPWP